MPRRNIYMQLDYDEYKYLEEQCLAFAEREHRSTDDDGLMYHKSFRIEIGDDLVIEFQGPLVHSPME